MIGCWYRGIPIQQNVRDNLSQDAIIVILCFQFSKFEIANSDELSVSSQCGEKEGMEKVYSLPHFHSKVMGQSLPSTNTEISPYL